jgi:hypothetical protein
MDIHKPKPWHGVREFLKEYLIIVVGVLTALGAEAVVEKLHENRLSAEAREAVRSEMNVNITNFARRSGQEACIDRKLGEIAALLEQADARRSFAVPGEVGAPLEPYVYTQRWQAATAGGRTSLLSSDEQRAFGRVYAVFDVIAKDEEEEVRAWMHLAALEGLRRVSPEMQYSQRIALFEARKIDNLVQSDIGQAKVYAATVGAKGDARLFMPLAAKPPHHNPICEPLAAAAPAAATGR